MGEGIRAKINDGTVTRSELFISSKVSELRCCFVQPIKHGQLLTLLLTQFGLIGFFLSWAKLWVTYNAPDMVEYACRTSLKNLGLDYIDLFMMHFPVSLKYENDETQWPKHEDGKTLYVT